MATFLLPLVALAMFYASDSHPVLLQEAAIVWPQRLAFMLYTHQEKPILTGPLAFLMPLGFWTFAALIFGLLARRVRSIVDWGDISSGRIGDQDIDTISRLRSTAHCGSG